MKPAMKNMMQIRKKLHFQISIQPLPLCRRSTHECVYLIKIHEIERKKKINIMNSGILAQFHKHNNFFFE